MNEPTPSRKEESWEDVEVRTCPLCGADRDTFLPFDRAKEGGRLLHYSLCRRCGLVFQAPRPSAATLARFYRDSYHGEMAGSQEGEERNVWVQKQRAEHLLSFVRQHLAVVEHHLDIGCSRGTFMQAVKGYYGSKELGVEPGREHRQLAEGKGLKVVPNLADVDADYRSNSDLISLSHVLEHVESPAEYLRRLRQDWIAPEGALLVEVPSLFWHPAYERSHLSVFTADSLRYALEAAGFELVAIRKHGTPYSRSIPLFLLALAKSSGGTAAAPLPRVRPLPMKLRRAVGLTLLRAARLANRLLRPAAAMRPWADGG